MPSLNAVRCGLIAWIGLCVVACSSTPTAPVIDRAPTVKKPSATSRANTSNDWRPSTYVVKKGDTLYRIGLEFGYDYKEIAAANQLTEPYPIKVGQTLILPSNESGVSLSTAPTATEDGVVITPVKTDAPTTAVETKSVAAAAPPLLTQPKAIREAYSLEAFQRKPNKPTDTLASAKKPVETPPKAIPTDTASTKPSEMKTAEDDVLSWAWPTTGKVISYFNEAANKGIDISGSVGQAIHAAANGKVIYTGSDLRGYGKLVIVKHNKTYLSVYAHNSKILVKEGQLVTTGQKIAEMGDTDANTVKLHFEIRQQGKSVDPMRYLKN